MSADAGAFRYLAGRAGIVTPDDPLPVIEEALRRYDIRWLVLERDHLVPALAPVLAGDVRPSWLSAPTLLVAARRRRTPVLPPGPGLEPAPARRPLRRLLRRHRHPMQRTMTPRAGWIVPVGLFLLALAVRLLVIPIVSMAPTEGAAYYVGVAANLVGGHGLVSDAVWSYATPPQVVPKPAFELWLPMATFIAALPMAVAGASLAAAQVGMAVLGALVAPLAWLVGREAAAVSGLDARRTRGVAITSGLLAAVLAPFVTAVAGPDSTTPFLVFGTLAALLGARPCRPWRAAGAGRGPPGWRSAWPSAWRTSPARRRSGSRSRGWRCSTADLRRSRPGPVLRSLVGALWPVVAGGLIVVVPWLVRNTFDLGSPLPGQAVENLWLRRNEDIFAWLDRPTASAYLARGAGAIVGDRDRRAHPPDRVGAGDAGVPRRSPGRWPRSLRCGGRRRSAGPTALALLLLGGLLTFLATALLFPVATQWGTYLHSAGPLLVGLVVATALGGDALLARISARRGWAQVNTIITPIALLAVAVPLLGLQLLILGRASSERAERFAAVATVLAARVPADGDPPPTFITDHPMWLAAATGATAIALPDEPLPAVADLARTYGARWLVVFDQDGRYPAELVGPDAAACLEGPALRVGPAGAPVVLARIDPECTPP